MEAIQRWRQPLNTTMTLNGDTQGSLVRFVARLQGLLNLWQYLFCQLQQDFTLGSET
ncbi:Regulator for metE and metH [Yersinia frederiksenii ATCC 33641]|nr:Regulator for metE and metH [Yersinia frederiksenii ATCC 33641]